MGLSVCARAKVVEINGGNMFHGSIYLSVEIVQVGLAICWYENNVVVAVSVLITAQRLEYRVNVFAGGLGYLIIWV